LVYQVLGLLLLRGFGLASPLCLFVSYWHFLMIFGGCSSLATPLFGLKKTYLENICNQKYILENNFFFYLIQLMAYGNIYYIA
jgi:hypothetical protein